jgi:hypothetical protein
MEQCLFPETARNSRQCSVKRFRTAGKWALDRHGIDAAEPNMTSPPTVYHEIETQILLFTYDFEASTSDCLTPGIIDFTSVLM